LQVAIQAVLVFGLSPRLPFDHSYQTFLRLVGAHAGLLQSEVHRIEVAEVRTIQPPGRQPSAL
jgi:hypothetical protein